jgi:hypothetical protein
MMTPAGELQHPFSVDRVNRGITPGAGLTVPLPDLRAQRDYIRQDVGSHLGSDAGGGGAHDAAGK